MSMKAVQLLIMLIRFEHDQISVITFIRVKSKGSSSQISRLLLLTVLKAKLQIKTLKMLVMDPP